MEDDYQPTELDYTQYYEENNLVLPNSRYGLDVPFFNYMGAPHKSWTTFAEMKDDAVELVQEACPHKEEEYSPTQLMAGHGKVVLPADADVVPRRMFSYWPVQQRTTEWMWLTGKANPGTTFADIVPIRITASQVPAIMGIDPNSSRAKIFKMKKFPETMDSSDVNEFTQSILNWGIEHEHVARQHFMRIIKSYDPQDVKPLRYVYECGPFHHGEYPWLGASPDGFFTELPYIDHKEAIKNMTCALEIKCPWKQVLPDVVPLHHMVQMQVSPV